MVTRGHKELQGLTKSYKGYRRLRVVTTSYKGLQGGKRC